MVLGSTQSFSTCRSLLSTISESQANYWASFVVDLTCPLLFAYLGLHPPMHWSSAIISFLAGLLAFSLAEYSIHRWLLHDPRSFLFYLHESHHANPGKPAGIPFPTSLAVLLPVWLLLTSMHFQPASFLLSGFSAGYLYFGVLHYMEHSTRINQIPFRWLQHRWAAHSVHHRLEQSNFGVMTSFWDYVFRTQYKRRQ
jgi:sterol desaturase/sphingolipid hydroxylase (fatty acid hydroxylase superfamily)